MSEALARQTARPVSCHRSHPHPETQFVACACIPVCAGTFNAHSAVLDCRRCRLPATGCWLLAGTVLALIIAVFALTAPFTTAGTQGRG
jgi:hypothetical protein